MYREFASADEMMAHYRAMNPTAAPIVPLARVDPKRAAAAAAAERIKAVLDHQKEREPSVRVSAALFFLLLASSRHFRNARAEYAVFCASRATGVSYDAIMGPRGKAPVARARMLAYAAVHTICPHWSYLEIGRVFRRDHSTVIHGIRSVDVEMLPRMPPPEVRAARAGHRADLAARRPPGAHPRHNPNRTKLTVEAAADIKRRLLAGERVCSIARVHGVASGTIHNVKTGMTWRWVSP